MSAHFVIEKRPQKFNLTSSMRLFLIKRENNSICSGVRWYCLPNLLDLWNKN